MAHLQYLPGDPRLVDQLVYELKSKGIFDQFRKECIADVDTRPAYQNLRQRVESSVATFLARQCWKPDLNKNQLREKLRKHILDGNYLEQGVERIVDQVVNPKVASVFIPQVEDLVYNFLGITRKKAPVTETIENTDGLLPTDLEAVSPGSVKSNDDKNTEEKTEKMEVEEELKIETQEDSQKKVENESVLITEATPLPIELEITMDNCYIPLPTDDINIENIPSPLNSPPKNVKLELDKITLPQEQNPFTHIPLPDEVKKQTDNNQFFKPILHSEDSNSSSDSSLRRNMSPLTPIRNFNNENSCDAQQGFDNDSDTKTDTKNEPSSFRFTIESDDVNKPENNTVKTERKESDPADLSYQFVNQMNINTFNTPTYDDSSNSNNLHIDYESDMNSKTADLKREGENSLSSKKDKSSEDRKGSHKSSHRSRDSSRHSSSKDKRSDSKYTSSRDSSRHEKKPSSSRDDSKHKSNRDRERSKDRSDKKDSRDSSKHRSSHKSSSCKDKDSKSHKSSSHRHTSSNKTTDDKKTSSNKDKHSESSKDKSSKEKHSHSKSSSHRSDKDRKSNSSSTKKSEDKDKKNEKKDTDDHYSLSGRGNHTRRSTDRDSNDGSSSSKGSQNQNGTKSTANKRESKSTSSKSDNQTSASGESASPSDKDNIVHDNSKLSQFKPIVRVDNHLETPIASPPRLPFVPDVTLKKPKFAANLQEAKKFMKMRKFLDDEQKRMNQEAALLLEFQANVRPSLSQVYSSIPGPELEFACVSNVVVQNYEHMNKENNSDVTIILDSASNSKMENKENTVSEHTLIENIASQKDNHQFIATDVSENVEMSQTELDKSYDENKPFSELMDEITKYSKASENKTKIEINEDILGVKNENVESEDEIAALKEEMEKFRDYDAQTKNRRKESKDKRMYSKIVDVDTKNDFKETNEEMVKPIDQVGKLKEVLITKEETVNSNQEAKELKEDTVSVGETKRLLELNENIHNKYFEVTIITEELSETEELQYELDEASKDSQDEEIQESNEVEICIENHLKNNKETTKEKEEISKLPENELRYFAEHEKYDAELARHEYNNFLQDFIENSCTTNKMFLINCDTYEENIFKEAAAAFGEFEIINYHKNGHLKLPTTSKNIVKNVTLAAEVALPVESENFEDKSLLFSPVKSECSFELCSDYDAKLEDINKKSRQEVLEIILGTITDESPSKMPKIDYYTECSIEETEGSLKRKVDEVDETSTENNNRSVLTPKRMRKLSETDQITSTTEETEEASNNNKITTITRSKYLGRARRVGLPRPKRSNITSSPTSDQSVENYTENTQIPPATPNGKMKSTPRSKVQRYDTSDLYKPKLHYLSRRNNVS